MENNMKSRISLLGGFSLLCVAVLVSAAWDSGPSDQTQPSTQQASASSSPGAKSSPRVDSFVLSSASARQFAGVANLMRRAPGFAFSDDSIARPKFGTSTAPQALARLQEVAQRFF